MWYQRAGILAVAIAALTGSTWLAYLSQAQSVSDLKIEPASKDFGRVVQNDRLPASFRIVNQTDAAVSVVQIIKTCDCTQPRLSKTTLSPHETGTMEVSWDVGTRHGPSAATVTLVTTSGARKSGFQYAQLELTADVQAEFLLDPESVKFNKSSGSQRAFVSFAASPCCDVSLKSFHSSHLALTVEGDDKRSGFWVLIDPQKWPADRDSAEIYVETTSRIEPRRMLVVQVK